MQQHGEASRRQRGAGEPLVANGRDLCDAEWRTSVALNWHLTDWLGAFFFFFCANSFDSVGWLVAGVLREKVEIFDREWYAVTVYTLYKGCCDYETMDKFVACGAAFGGYAPTGCIQLYG